MKILEPQYGANFVGRDFEIHELKSKIRNNGVVIVTGDRGIGKTNLMKILEGFFKMETECYYIETGSIFSIEMNRLFLPERTKTGFSWSISIPQLGGGGAGVSWKSREPSILEFMEKSKSKIIFVENAHELKKEEKETIFAAAHRNDQLKFVLEIATPNFPDVKLNIIPDQVVELKKLRDEDIEKIIRIECPNFQDEVVKKIIFLSKGYPYIARSLAYICDKKNTPDEMLEFLNTLRDDDIKYILDQVHKEVLDTLGKNGQDIIKKLAIAPPILTKRLIMAFCGEEIDTALIDINERGILRYDENFCWIYHPLFRDYLRSTKIQPIAMGKKKELYRKAMEQVKSEFESIYILFGVLNDPDIFKELIEIAENFNAINAIATQSYSLEKLDNAILGWSLIQKKAKETKTDIEWKSIAIGNLGNIYQIKGDLDIAMEYYENALKLNEDLGLKQGMITIYGNMGIVYQTKGNLDKAMEYHEKAFELTKELGRKDDMASVSGNIGLVYKIKGELDKALEYYENALKLNTELERKEGLAITYGNIGNVYRIKEDLDKALQYNEIALKMYTELNSKIGIATAFGNIGNIYQIKGDYVKAMEYLFKALRLHEILGRKEGIVATYGNIGNIHQIKGELDKALEYYENALELNKELGSKIIMADLYGNIGSVYHAKEEFDKTLEYYMNALGIFKEVGAKVEEALTLKNIGDVLVIKDNKEQGINFYLEAQDLAIGNPSLFWEISRKINVLLGIH